MLADGSSHAPIEVRLRNARGEYRTIEAAFSNRLMDEDVQAVVVNGHDVTERVAAASDDVFKALHDSLTGLPNRPLMLDRAGVALHRAERLHQQVALLCVDIDHFRVIVDGHGQDGAHFVLAETARRIVNAVRASDTVARTGTDKFVVVAEGVTRADVSTIAGRIRTAMNEPILLPDASLARIDVSLGIALAGGGEPAPLARDAETALQTAKRQGRGRAVVFEQRQRREGGAARQGHADDGRILSESRTW
jgi:diguanylate cyclase (GGDEF)-like protein